MATNPLLLPENVGRITPGDANYSYGSAKNDSTGTTGDGTPIRASIMNDRYGFDQALLRASGIIPSGSAENQLESQYLQCIVEQSAGRAMMTFEAVGSVADAYIVDASTNNQPPATPFSGLRITCLLSNNNTGSTTLNAFGFGSAIVRNIDNSILSGDQIKGGELTELIFIGGGWKLLPSNELDLKFRGKSFNGLHQNLTVDFTDVDLVKFNCEFVYDQSIPGVTTVAADGVLKTTMGDVTNRGMQTFTINQVSHSQFGEVHRRFLSTSGTWLPWENVTPKKGRFVSDELGDASIDGDYFSMNSILDGVWASVGPPGSGADILVGALSDAPDDIDWVEIKINQKCYQLGISLPGGTLYKVSVYARNFGSTIVKTAGSAGEISVASFYVSTGDSLGYSETISTVKIPVNSKRFELIRTENDPSQPVTVSNRMNVIGYGYNN